MVTENDVQKMAITLSKPLPVIHHDEVPGSNFEGGGRGTIIAQRKNQQVKFDIRLLGGG